MSIEVARALTGYYNHDCYGWVITKDNISGEGEESDKGTMGPAIITEDITNRLNAGEGKRFRMLDDDGVICYYGRIILPPEDEEWEDEYEFRPLTDFGEPNVGATEIQYWDDDKKAYVTL